MPEKGRITREEVVKVARLAGLSLEEVELDRLTGELGKVLDHFASLQRLDTAGVPPASDVLSGAAPLREDAVRPGLAPGDALRNAPVQEDGAFVVPRILATGKAGA